MSTYSKHHTTTTYADFHNRLKETVMISCQTGLSSYGVSEQLLKLYNPKNEYYGTFKGNVDLSGSYLSGVHLCSVVIDNAQLSGKILLADGTDLNNLTNGISCLKNDFAKFKNEVRSELDQIKSALTQLQQQIEHISDSNLLELEE